MEVIFKSIKLHIGYSFFTASLRLMRKYMKMPFNLSIPKLGC